MPKATRYVGVIAKTSQQSLKELPVAQDIMIPAWKDGVLQPIEKLLVHQIGLRHKAVSVFVVSGRKILMQQRAKEKYHTPGLWANTCCTHPNWGERADICAVRRLKEELGIVDVTPQFKGQVEYRADVGGGLTEHEVVDIFTCQVGLDLAYDLNPSEVMNARWIDIEDLKPDVLKRPELYTPWLAIYLSQYSDLIF